MLSTAPATPAIHYLLHTTMDPSDAHCLLPTPLLPATCFQLPAAHLPCYPPNVSQFTVPLLLLLPTACCSLPATHMNTRHTVPLETPMSTAAWCPQSTPSACDANHAPVVPSAPATPAVPTAPTIPATHYLLPTPIDPPAARHRLPTSPLTHQLLLTACCPLPLLYAQPASWYLLPTHTHHLLLTVPATPYPVPLLTSINALTLPSFFTMSGPPQSCHQCQPSMTS